MAMTSANTHAYSILDATKGLGVFTKKLEKTLGREIASSSSLHQKPTQEEQLQENNHSSLPPALKSK